MSTQGQGIPITNFYLRDVDNINEAERTRNYHLMFRLLLIISDTFHKNDRKKCQKAREILEKYVREIDSTHGRNYNQTFQLRSKKSMDFYNNGGRLKKLDIFDVMWSGGYISKRDYRGIDLSKFNLDDQADVEIY